jgi:hypothetical protein
VVYVAILNPALSLTNTFFCLGSIEHGSSWFRKDASQRCSTWFKREEIPSKAEPFQDSEKTGHILTDRLLPALYSGNYNCLSGNNMYVIRDNDSSSAMASFFATIAGVLIFNEVIFSSASCDLKS